MALLITAARVLADPSGPPVTGGAVLVTGTTITAVGSETEVRAQAPPGVRELAYPDGTVLPGLVNSHVHLAFDASTDPVAGVRERGDADLVLGMAGRARRLLDGGVTTARDLGDRDGLALLLRDAIADHRVPGPRLLCAGAPLTVPGGHCWFLGGEVDGTAQIRERVRATAAAGAQVIKVMASGGQLTPGGAAMWEAQFDAEALSVVVAAARAEGLPVAAHAHGTESIAAAVRAGVHTIEHCTWMGADGQPDLREDLAREIAELGIHVCSAMSRNWRGFAERIGPERARRHFERLRWMDGLGISLIPGTDAGLPGSVFEDYTGALELYRHVGFGNNWIIEAATTRAAGALGVGGRTGRLAAGFDADLLVVRGDPLAELEALRDLRLVLARGREHHPEPVREQV